MEKIVNIKNISDFNTANNHKTLHPLVTVIDYSNAKPRDWGEVDTIKFQYGLYSVILKDVVCGDMSDITTIIRRVHWFFLHRGSLQAWKTPKQFINLWVLACFFILIY
jgi:hypothetical protein